MSSSSAATPHNEMSEHGTQKEAESKSSPLSQSETKVLRKTKVVVMVVLFLCMVGISAGVYITARSYERTAFEDRFQEAAARALNAIGANFDQSFSTIDAFSVSLASYANAANMTWPFVTIPDFALRASKILPLSRATVMNLYMYVEEDEREAWENYTEANNGWVEGALEITQKDKNFHGLSDGEAHENWDIIYGDSEWDNEESSWGTVGTPESSYYYPMWHSYPLSPYEYPAYNWNLAELTYEEHSLVLDLMKSTNKTLLTQTYLLFDPTRPQEVTESELLEAAWIEDFIGPDEIAEEPIFDILYPIFDVVDEITIPASRRSEALGAWLSSTIYWRDMVKDVLPSDDDSIVVVFISDCSPTFSYQVDGTRVKYLGLGDHHDSHKFDKLKRHATLNELDTFASRDFTFSGTPLQQGGNCTHLFEVYPSIEMEERSLSRSPLNYSILAFCVFALTALVFIVYDIVVERRQRRLMLTATRTNDIVASLFPSTIRDRMVNGHKPNRNVNNGAANKLLSFVSGDGTNDVENANSDPIAEFFPDTTIIFADISGFTPWSSTRAPGQVFTLLESLYKEFDEATHRYRVYKIETIGDCYVAASGLPLPNKNHALSMVRFAVECRSRMRKTMRQLSSTLGPGTMDLGLRIGIHSGPVMAGVLRGERSRFQLFGDTMNTCERIESSGSPGRIHVSEKTAELLSSAGKSGWLTKRRDKVNVKGKGTLETFWVEPCSPAAKDDASTAYDDDFSSRDSGMLRRLVEWNVDTLTSLLEELYVPATEQKGLCLPSIIKKGKCDATKMQTIDEVADVLHWPVMRNEQAGQKHALPEMVHEQLRTYISVVARLYREENPFHNFEHATHVAMSVVKILNRVCEQDSPLAHKISDPLTRFACVFSAVVHDAAHPGVSNDQLVKQKSPIATLYNGKSVAEQNSVDLVWSLLTDDDSFAELVKCISGGKPSEFRRFRQLLVNAVMATDIMDKNLKARRDNRWEEVFSEEQSKQDPKLSQLSIEKQASIVLELIIQSSDVIHTMQHWEIYQKWNRRLFLEIKNSGQGDPASKWYKGELWFFDNYVLMLSRKLKTCQVFGVSCEEFHEYALANRREWETKGNGIVEEMQQLSILPN